MVVPENGTMCIYFCSKIVIDMFKMVILGLSCIALTSCAVPQKTEISKFTADMNVVRSHRVDLYERYMKGEIEIDDVYLDRSTTIPFYGVDYHAVQFVPANAGK